MALTEGGGEGLRNRLCDGCVPGRGRGCSGRVNFGLLNQGSACVGRGAGAILWVFGISRCGDQNPGDFLIFSK